MPALATACSVQIIFLIATGKNSINSHSVFSAKSFQLITTSDHLTPPAKYQAENLARYDVFASYQYWQTVEAALKHIGQRLARENPLTSAAHAMKPHYKALEAIF